MLYIIFCIFLLLLVALLAAKIILLRRAAREISAGFLEKLETDTNTLISISTRDRSMRQLAASVNTGLRELREKRHRFVQGDRELKNAITNISHDLRTPLTAISGYLDLLDTAEKSETVSRYTEIIKNRVEVLAQLTEELLRYSMAASPEYSIVSERVVVNAVLEESISSFYAVLQEKNMTPDIHITEQKIVRELNAAALSRVFSNLIGNAIKYSDGDLCITLTDEGRIIFSNHSSRLGRVQVEQLFERFYTVENARKSTGLGLSIAKTLVEQMGGRITAEYQEGRLVIAIEWTEG